MKNTSIANTLKSMTTKQKVSYVWDYYKIHILSTLALLFLIISFTYSQLTTQETYFDITYIGASINVDELSHVDDSLNQIVLDGSSKEVINLDSIFTDNSSDNLNEQLSQKFMVKIAAKEIDMAIVSKKFFEDNYSSDMFLNLESLEGFSLLPIDNDEVIKRNDSNGNLASYGIAINKLNLLKDVNFASNDYILVAIANSERTNRTLDILKVFLEK